MRRATILATLLALTLAMAGCLAPGEPIEPASTSELPDADEPTDEPGQGNEQDSATNTTEDNQNEPGDEAPPEQEESSNQDAEPQEDPLLKEAQGTPTVVLAHIDTGINPYHEAFRDDSILADIHPSHYIDGYPDDAEPLNLTLDADSYEDALEADQDIWNNVTEDTLYWIPGTRIDAAVSFGASQSYCEIVGLPHEYTAVGAADALTDTASEETGEDDPLDCPDAVPILDTFGHGTMTASRAAGQGTSLCEDCRIATIEGLGGSAVEWATEQGWIDVQTNSWVDLVPAPINQQEDDSTTDAVANAAQQMVTVFATGNGAAYVAGAAPTPTYTLSTAPPGVILVGAHDNGYMATWSGSPPHIIADGFQSLAAAHDSLSDTGPLAFACCTSSAAPYAAGGFAHMIHLAREALEDTSNGVDNGTLAQGTAGAVPIGPLNDGALTLDELKRILFTTAQHPPQEGPHDGNPHWLANPTSGSGGVPGFAGNPYCGMCWTTPIPYEEIPGEVPTYAYTGYGAINPTSIQDAFNVLAGAEDRPDRAQADMFYDLDQDLREAYYPS